MERQLHHLENVVDALFEEVCPQVVGGQRAFKPVLVNSLGSLLVDTDRRQLLDHRAYYRLDFSDFLEFATSEIPIAPSLSAFRDGEAHFYQALNIDSPEPHVELPTPLSALAILDAVISRNGVFLSVTMRFSSFPPDTQPFTVVTITFAPSRGVDSEHANLDEWDRCWIAPPVPADPEWRFFQSGVYTDALLDEMERHPGMPGAFSSDLIERVRSQRALTHGEWAGYFELARLALYLPQYFDFMYDLVVTDSVTAEPDRPFPRGIAPASPKVGPVPTGPLFRVVKSIRVIRAMARPARHWTAPRFSFAVTGHWRRFRDPQANGHDATGQVVLGRTWVHDYKKFRHKELSPGNAETGTADPRVVISIKQSLAYARDVLASAGTTMPSDPPSASPDVPASGQAARVVPTDEWMATERAKLTFQMRYLILRRDHYRCRLCGRSAASDPGVRLEVDHRTPVSDWGLTVESNLWTLCRECNRGKGVHALHVD